MIKKMIKRMTKTPPDGRRFGVVRWSKSLVLMML